MGMALIHGEMAESTLVITSLIKKVVLESIFGMTEEYLKEIG